MAIRALRMTSGSLAVLAALLTSASALAQPPQRGVAVVRVTNDQLHQLNVEKVELYPFRVQKPAIGQISYNEDLSTVVLTPFPGRVTRLVAKIGDKVQRGDPLFEIDSSDVVQPQNEFVAAVGAVNKTRAQLDLAVIVEQRNKNLYEGRAAPLKEWQQAQAELISAQNDYRSAQTALDAALHRLRILGRTEAEIAALREKGAISRTLPIHAPIAGTVVGRKVGPGQYVRSDATDPLYTISYISSMWLKAFVPETDIPRVKVGQAIEVRVSALPERTFQAQIVAIGAASDATTRRVMVRSEIPNPDGALKAEMFASFKIEVGADERSPAVPVEAVIREGDLAFVWVERPDEPLTMERRPVKIGMEQNRRVQIRDGLNAGERVVGRGAIFVDNEWKQ